MTADTDPVDVLVQAAFLVMGVLSSVAKENALSLTQVRVFGIIRDRQPRISDLAAFLGLDKSTLTGLVDRAAERGLVERIRNQDDARSVRVQLTRDGHALADRVHEQVRRELAPRLARLDPRTQEAVAGHLSTMLDTPAL